MTRIVKTARATQQWLKACGAAGVLARFAMFAIAFAITQLFCLAQNATERNFPASVSVVQSAIKKLPGGTSGPLPILDGFALSGAHSFSTLKRPYYQCAIHVTPVSSGGSIVRVTAKITAWNDDPSHPGYEVLQSNGRIESDLLDRLQEALGVNGSSVSSESPASAPENPAATARNSSPAPEIAAPLPQFPSAASGRSPLSAAVPENSPPDQEEKGLEDLLQKQAHPTNLIAVRQDQTPVLQDPSSDGKLLFFARAEDEFEILDINSEWVHVRISGLSRGWLRRSSVELLDGSESLAENAAPAFEQPPATPAESSKLFAVSGEEDGNFPGDWAALKGKSVKIISIQQAQNTGRITSPQEKMRFAENLFRSEDSQTNSAGLVLIFDAEDGGMIAATRSVIDLWRTGAISEQAFWKQCFLDPPEILGNSN